MNVFRRSTIAAAILLPLALAGCRTNVDTRRADIQSAINSYYQAHPVCLWPNSVQFPTNFDSSSPKTDGYDALTDEGYLTRLQSTKKVFIFGSKQVSNYDLSDKGRGIWTPDPQQAGYGNFCYGHRSVTTLDSIGTSESAVTNSPNAGQGPLPVGSTARANYHYTVSDAAAWANNDKIKNSFPGVASTLSGPQSDTANLEKTGEHVWQVTSVPSAGMPANNPSPELGSKSNDFHAVGDKPQP